MENDELNQLIKAARGAAFFIKSVDGYENSKIANQLLMLADKVERQKLLAIGRLAARVVYRNSKKAVEHSVQRTGLYATSITTCLRLKVIPLVRIAAQSRPAANANRWAAHRLKG